MNDDLQKRHMETWARAAEAAWCYMNVRGQGRGIGDPELCAARAVLLAELTAMLDLAEQLDTELPLWKKVFYVQATQNMIAACHLSAQEIDDYRSAVERLEYRDP